MKRTFILAALLMATSPAFACGGALDRGETAQMQLSILDDYIAHPQKLDVVRISAMPRKQGSDVSPLTQEQWEKARTLRTESAGLIAAAADHRLRHGIGSKLAALQFARASEKSGQALQILGAPVPAPTGSLARCGGMARPPAPARG